MTHPAAHLDDTIHQRVRLGILAVLLESRRADFAYLRDALELTDGNLSQHLRILEESGYVEIAKTFEGKKTRTWVAATRAGRSALATELATLRALLKQVAKPSRS
jgi:DNA-binding MarR family transcriptional regulator